MLDRDGIEHLVFVEHDRSTEPVKELARKFALYVTWFQNAPQTRETFGYPTFTLLVTVAGRTAMRRLERLIEVAHASSAAPFTRLTIHRLAATNPAAPIWIDASALPPKDADGVVRPTPNPLTLTHP